MYLRLIKYKLSLAVTLTGSVGYILYGSIDPALLILFSLGTFLLAGGASGLNQYQEREFDTIMTRTSSRPIPSGSLKPGLALWIIIGLIAAGLAILLYVSIVTALLGFINILFYNLLYTKLKRITYLAILPGAIVGAIPPVMGWTAAGGSPFEIRIIYISLLIFLWQIPHFWMLLVRYRNDYEAAGFPTVMKKLDEAQVKRIVFTWIAMMSLFSLTPFLFGITINRVIWVIMAATVLIFIISFFMLLFSKREDSRRAFILSNIFISLIYLLFAAGSLIK
jgi:protoheme IX farnesyltransferase